MMQRNSTVEQIRKGDKFTFLDGTSYYLALSDYEPGRGVYAEHFWRDGTPLNGLSASYIAGPRITDNTVTILNRDPNKEKSNTMNTEANEEKLWLANEWNLKAKFSYTNERGETRTRRLAVDSFDGEVVGGQSYDENGSHEGYRQFRLDRINDDIVIR